jgi:hypothetical protein
MKFYIRAYTTTPNFEFSNEWIEYGEHGMVTAYATKPDNWREGTFDSGPIFLQEGIGEEQTQLTLTYEGDAVIGTYNGYIYQFRYQCFYQKDLELPYVVLGWYRRSTQTFQDLEFLQTTHLVSVLEENSLEEILHKIMEEFNTATGLKMKYEYNNTQGRLKLTVADSIVGDPLPIEIRLHSVDAAPILVTPGDDIRSLLRFLNQDDGFTNYQYLVEPGFEKEFTSDVWDRKRVQFHSTFSDARNKYIGSNGDKYDSISKLYRYVLTDPMFYIRFTTDGRHSFIPRYTQIIIELCFILNYQRTVLLE